MNLSIILLSLVLFWSCTSKPKDTTNNNEQQVMPGISVIDAKPSISLALIDFKSSERKSISQKDKNKIKEIIIDYYMNECVVDSSEMYYKPSDAYFNTLRIIENDKTFYWIILKHQPTNLINSKILVLNTKTNQYYPQIIDFNLNALYSEENGQLIPSNLKEELNINTPEFEIIKSTNELMLKLSRLYHNGTANQLEIKTLEIKDNQIDTIQFIRKDIK